MKLKNSFKVSNKQYLQRKLRTQERGRSVGSDMLGTAKKKAARPRAALELLLDDEAMMNIASYCLS